MFELLDKEIAEYQALNNKNPQIYMGIKTYEYLIKSCLNTSYLMLHDLKENSFVSTYKGVKINKANFEYGYYLE
jgi:hypothetical protein